MCQMSHWVVRLGWVAAAGWSRIGHLGPHLPSENQATLDARMGLQCPQSSSLLTWKYYTDPCEHLGQGKKPHGHPSLREAVTM